MKMGAYENSIANVGIEKRNKLREQANALSAGLPYDPIRYNLGQTPETLKTLDGSAPSTGATRTSGGLVGGTGGVTQPNPVAKPAVPTNDAAGNFAEYEDKPTALGKLLGGVGKVALGSLGYVTGAPSTLGADLATSVLPIERVPGVKSNMELSSDVASEGVGDVADVLKGAGGGLKRLATKAFTAGGSFQPVSNAAAQTPTPSTLQDAAVDGAVGASPVATTPSPAATGSMVPQTPFERGQTSQAAIEANAAEISKIRAEERAVQDGARGLAEAKANMVGNRGLFTPVQATSALEQQQLDKNTRDQAFRDAGLDPNDPQGSLNRFLEEDRAKRYGYNSAEDMRLKTMDVGQSAPQGGLAAILGASFGAANLNRAIASENRAKKAAAEQKRFDTTNNTTLRGQDLQAATSKYNSDNSLRGQIYSSDLSRENNRDNNLVSRLNNIDTNDVSERNSIRTAQSAEATRIANADKEMLDNVNETFAKGATKTEGKNTVYDKELEANARRIAHNRLAEMNAIAAEAGEPKIKLNNRIAEEGLRAASINKKLHEENKGFKLFGNSSPGVSTSIGYTLSADGKRVTGPGGFGIDTSKLTPDELAYVKGLSAAKK